MTSLIRLDTSDGIARLVFARPERLNAFDFEMGRQYRDACVAAVSSPDTRAILITAEGPAFCAGGDVLAMAGAGVAGSEVTAGAHMIHEGLAALTGSAIPVVVAARGAVAGGGIGLMLAADYVVAGKDLRMAGKYADIGLTPDLGVSTLLARAVGERRALTLLLTSRELDAETALEWGAVAEVAADPEARAEEVARHWAAGAAGALGQAKRLVRASVHRPFAESLEDEAGSIGRAFDGEEARARIAAFAAASASRTGARTGGEPRSRTLAGTTILMSGGSRGIGLAIAIRAARDGANVAILAKTDAPHPTLEGTVHTAAAAIREAGGHPLAIVGDVRNDEDIARAVAQTVEAFGGIDVVVNNASVIDLSPTAKLEAKRYDLMQDVNVRGTLMLSQAAMPHLLASSNPHILTLSPPLNPTPRWLGAYTGYALSKFGMTMVTLGLAAEFAKRGVAANTLWPATTIATAAVRNLRGGEKLMARSRTPEVYADAAYEVITSPSRELTGQSLVVEDVLKAAGVTDFATYAAVPGTPDEDLFPDVFLD